MLSTLRGGGFAVLTHRDHLIELAVSNASFLVALLAATDTSDRYMPSLARTSYVN